MKKKTPRRPRGRPKKVADFKLGKLDANTSGQILDLIYLMIGNGIVVIVDSIDQLKQKGGRDFGTEEIRALMTGPPPSDEI